MPHSGSEYHRVANVLRLLAEQTRFPEGRARLLALADSFERLAEHSPAWAELAEKTGNGREQLTPREPPG